MDLSLLLFISLCLAAGLLLLLHGRHGANKQGSQAKELPPGPPALLFLAKFLGLGRSIFDIGPLLSELHARHGPVVSVRLFRTTVFVADRHIAHRVLVQNGANFADRPPVTDPGRLFSSDGRDMTSSPYGPYWRLLRRNLAVEVLQPARLALFAPERRRALDALVRELRARGGSPAQAVTLRPFLRRTISELAMYMCSGARPGQEVLDEVGQVVLQILRSMNSFPVFSFLPSLTKRLFRKRWAGYVAVWRRQRDIFLPLIQARRAAPPRGGADDPPCYADSLLALRVAEEGGRPLTDGEVASLCTEFVGGATDSTVTLIEWIMAEMVNRPDVQAKLYEEVKADGDLQAMPYLKAVVLEGLRLHPPGRFLLPHCVWSDAEIGGYSVPKGAEVNFLLPDFGLDEAVWTAAREFRPERFLDGGEGCGVDLTGSREIKMMPFGAGRRMCPGFTLGMLHVEYFVGSLVREFQWMPAVEGENVDMAERKDFTTVMKNPLSARAISRSPTNY